LHRNLLYYFKIGFIWLLYLPIVFATYLIVWLDRKLKFSLPFPRDVAALAKAEPWCITELTKNGVLPAGAVVNSYRVTPLNQDLIFRSNAGIIEINYHLAASAKVLKCFAKFAPTMGTVWNRTIFNLQLNHIKEISFNQYFIKADNSISAPLVYYSNVSARTGNLCLITEYMSDCMEFEGVREPLAADHLHQVMEGMATLHARYWKSTEEKMKKVFPIKENTLYLFDSIIASGWSTIARDVMIKSWRKMNERETVLHGDMRLGNMMFPKEDGKGRFVFIDWQAVRQGKAAYDLAYFLMLSLRAEHCLAEEKNSMDIYAAYLAAKGVQHYTREELEEDYGHACLCVLVLLSLPMLSGEVSADGEAARVFKYGMGIWHSRMQAKFSRFDYLWMADRYALTEPQARSSVEEMLGVIEQRLSRIQGISVYAA
jgi:hypothetical protein